MVYRGYVRDGKVVMGEGVKLPEGAEVEVTLKADGACAGPRHAQDDAAHRVPSIEEELEHIWAEVPQEEWDKLPPDLTDHLDHYIYGVDKQ
jgi:hypothetical protein